MKNLIKLLVCIISMMIISPLYAFNLITSCNNCTDDQYRRMAERTISNGAIVIVVDADNANVHAYKIRRTKVDDNIDVSVAIDVAVPDDVKINFSKVVSYKNEYIDDLKREFGSLNIEFEALGVDEDIQEQPVNVMSTNASYGAVNAYDFISDSSLRRRVFSRLTTQYPTFMEINKYWNNMVNLVNESFLGGKVGLSVNLDILEFTPTFTFEDGSFVIARYNMVSKTFTVKSGVDEAGNDIPLDSSSGIGGVYVIRDAQHFEDFKDYMSQHWWIHFRGNLGYGQSCTSSCKLISVSEWECTAQCK